jgi:hypothetical protein
VPLADRSDAVLAALAQDGLARLAQASAGRHLVPPPVAPAFLAGWQTEALLRQVLAGPGRVKTGAMGLSGFTRRGKLLWAALSGRW